MRALALTFPLSAHLLCVWHISKNILSKCKKNFSTNDDWEEFIFEWKTVISSRTPDSFEAAWKKFQTKFSFNQKKSINYIEETWLVHKEKFVQAYVDKHMHLGSRATSRIEGAHAILKRWLEVSTGDLYIIYGKIKLMLEYQNSEFQKKLTYQKSKIITETNLPICEKIITKVSHFAATEISKQYKIFMSADAENGLGECTDNIRSIMGLPCAHEIKVIVSKKLKFNINDIHPQWHLFPTFLQLAPTSSPMQANDFSDLIIKLSESYNNWSTSQQAVARARVISLMEGNDLVLLPPQVQKTRGRPHGAKNKISSLKRDHSEFEYHEISNKVDGDELTKADPNISSRKCGVCGKYGHNSRSHKKEKKGDTTTYA